MDAENLSPQFISENRPRLWRRFLAVGLGFGAAMCAVVWAMSGGEFGAALFAAIVSYAVTGAAAVWGFAARYPHQQMGLCNVVTLSRLAMTAALFGALFQSAPAIGSVLALAAVAFALDGVDGWLARRAQLTSAFGARFDMEVDSAFALVLACLAVQGGLNPLVILLGLPRYIFGGAQLMFPWLNGPLPERFSRKLICVLQIAALIVLLFPWLLPGLRHAIAGLAGALVIWSFLMDIRVLWQTRA